MSFLPSDLASWALRSVRARNTADDTNDDTETNQQQQQQQQQQQSSTQTQSSTVQQDEQDIRAKRLARLSGTATAPTPTATTASMTWPISDNFNTNANESMPVVSMFESPTFSAPATEDIVMTDVFNATSNTKERTNSFSQGATATSSSSFKATTAGGDLGAGAERRRRRKKELLLQKTFRIILSGGGLSTSSSSSDSPPCVIVDIGHDPMVTDQNISEIIASRLALSSDDLSHIPFQDRNLILYLASCHRRVSEEFKNMISSTNTLPSERSEAAILQNELLSILKEMKSQIVSYAASMLLEPDLFEMGKDGCSQLARALISSTLDPISSISYCVTGKGSSFLSCLCDELAQTNEVVFTMIIQKVVEILNKNLIRLDCVLEETPWISSTAATTSSQGNNITMESDGQNTSVNGLVLVSALSAFSSAHKKVVAAIVSMPNFLLPPLNSPVATERVSTEFLPFTHTDGNSNNGTDPQRFIRMMMAMSRGSHRGASTGYLRRSGPALEKETLLGSILKIGLPMEHPQVFSSFKNAATKTMSDISKSNDGLRKQLCIYQEAIHSLIRSWITAGEDCRKQVMNFFIDALLVNIGADAFRPDKTKVCQTHTLLNLSSVLLRLCEPFRHDPTRIDSAFISSPKDHGGVFALMGELAVSRLGENEVLASNPNIPTYQPKNAFIPQVFFFCARSIHFGLSSSASYHTTLTRQVNHTMWNLRQRNADAAVDPALNHLLTMQYSNEVTILSPSVLEETLKFVNLVAGVVLRCDNDILPYIPEHFVDDICDILVFVARFQPKALENIDLGDVFRMSVKLLSPDYAHVVKNYNLRAKLGDVLHDVYLPAEKDSRWSVPESVSCDPFASGAPFLISDVSAKETLAPSLLLLYGEVEHTGFYDKMGHRANIASLLKYLWDSGEHRQAFRRITQNKDSFIKFANGVMNENNSLIASVMEKLQEIRRVQLQLSNPQEWALSSEEQRETITSRHEENEQEVKRALPLCNKTLQMLGYLNTDTDIRRLFLLEEMCPRLVNMLLHVVTKLVGSKGMDLKVDNPELYNFRPKEMLRDLCSILASFTDEKEFQVNCAKSGYYSSELLQKTVKTCTKLNLLSEVSMKVLNSLPSKIEAVARFIQDDEAILADAPEEFLDPLMVTFMKDPVFLPTSGNIVDRSTIMQHLLNDAHDPFNRKDLTLDMIEPAYDLKRKMEEWISSKRSLSYK